MVGLNEQYLPSFCLSLLPLSMNFLQTFAQYMSDATRLSVDSRFLCLLVGMQSIVVAPGRMRGLCRTRM